MKSCKQFLLLTLCGLLLLGATACGGDQTSSDTTVADTTVGETEPPAPVDLTLDTSYTLVRPESADQSIVDAVSELRNAITNKTGLTLAPASDWYNPRETNVTFAQTEILIGSTNRPETAAAAETLRWEDYVITAESGKVVILGGSDEATVRAIKYYINKYASMTTISQTELYRYTEKYDVDELTLDGVAISDYTLVYPAADKDVYQAAAESFNARLREISGYSLTICSDRDAEAAHEIWFGPVSRTGAEAKPAESLAWAITPQGKHIQLNAGSSYGMTALVEQFFATYLEGQKGTVSLELKAETGTISLPQVALEAEADVRIMSSNILFDATLGDRVPLIAAFYMKHYPDIIGMQEVNSTGQKVLSLVSDFYASTSTAFSDGKICCTPILYRKDKYNLVESGCQLYDSRATDTKSMSWVVLENKETGKKIALCNTHSSLILASYNMTETNGVEGEQWRTDNVRQLLEKTAEIRAKYGDIPVFITGDFNANQNSTSIKTMTQTLANSATIAVVSKTTGIASFHNNPGEYPKVGGLPIDFVFVTDDVAEVRVHCIPNDAEAVAISDHCPVYVDVKLK